MQNMPLVCYDVISVTDRWLMNMITALGPKTARYKWS